MEIVQPIRQVKDIDAIKRSLKSRSMRDYALFVLGINSGLRISDLLNLRVKDVVEPGNRRIKICDRMQIREKKTRKAKDFPINTPARTALGEYLRAEQLCNESVLFPSRKGCKAISPVQAWRIISDAAKSAGISERIGTHSMRKTFAYHAYKKGVDISHLQQLLNHASQTETLRYMGILRDDLDEVYRRLSL